MADAVDRVEHVYRAESLKMWRALVGFTADRELAYDAVAEAFARALQEGDAIRDVRAWTWRVAFRIASHELRARRRASSPQLETAEPPSDDLPALVVALRRLPTKQRLALVLHDYADRPTDEVAKILGCSRATVHVHLSSGRRRLRGLLEVTDA